MITEILEIKAKVMVTEEDIDDIMTSALLSVRYWCDLVSITEDKLAAGYIWEQIARGRQLALHVEEPFDDNETEWYCLDKEKFMKGLKMYLEDPVYDCIEQDGKNFIANLGNVDGECADMIVQYALFGEVVYG